MHYRAYGCVVSSHGLAHRLSTIRNVDRIYVLEGGRIVESGHFDYLMKRDGMFAALARRQLIRL